MNHLAAKRLEPNCAGTVRPEDENETLRLLWPESIGKVDVESFGEKAMDLAILRW